MWKSISRLRGSSGGKTLIDSTRQCTVCAQNEVVVKQVGVLEERMPHAHGDLSAMPEKIRRQSAEPHRLSLEELAKRTQCTPRTIRFYIARGLLPGPVKAGRDGFYGEEHVRRMEWIRRWQRQGLTLAESAARIHGGCRIGTADAECLVLVRYPSGCGGASAFRHCRLAAASHFARLARAGPAANRQRYFRFQPKKSRNEPDD